jgi:hypothetical protein
MGLLWMTYAFSPIELPSGSTWTKKLFTFFSLQSKTSTPGGIIPAGAFSFKLCS